MTKKIFLFTLLMTTTLFCVEIPTQNAQSRKFGKSIDLNAQVIQLSNAGQSVTSLVRGHLEKYFVEAGQKVKAGQKIALIESILVSKMTADYISLKKQYSALEKNYEASQKLYKSGMTSMSALNTQTIKKNAMLAEINRLKSQLDTLSIDTKKLHKATANFMLYAHSGGRVSQLLQPLHTVVGVDEAVISIIKDQAFYIKSFVPLEYARSVKVGQKMVVSYNDRDIITHVKQILPALDETTQRIVLLSSVDEKTDDLFINSFVKATLYFKTDKTCVAVEKSALSFFENEWVVFVTKEEEHHEEGLQQHNEEHTEVPYEVRVVKIVAKDEKYVGVKGLEEGEEYVSDKSYYVKSMLLKSSLGEHGH